MDINKEKSNTGLKLIIQLTCGYNIKSLLSTKCPGEVYTDDNNNDAGS